MFAAYIRVSTVGQNEEGQRREVEKWLISQNIGAVKWYVDRESGDTLDRTAFADLQADIFKGDVAGVVVWKLDRLSRSMRDGINTLADWCDRGIRFVSVTQQLDFNGALGRMLAAVFLGIAEMEQETRRERQKVGIEAAKERGTYRGRKPGTTKAKPLRATQLRGKGLTHAEIATALGVSRQTVISYLKKV